MLWINFLHFYQPANADRKKIQEATEKSYERIIRGLEENSNIKFTANISGCLLVRLDEEFKRIDLIRRIKRLVLKKQLELVGSAAYHALLPLVDIRQAREQIVENKRILNKYFGENIKIKGFFFPEMAYSKNTAELISSLGYEWVILDEISGTGKLNNANLNKVYTDSNSKLKVIFRNREFSQTYIPETILNNSFGNNDIVVSATDAELYGLRHIDEPANFEKLLANGGNKNLNTQFISNYIESKKDNPEINLVESSWESSEQELSENKPFDLWFNKTNIIQVKLMELANLAQSLYYKYSNDKNIWWSKWHLVRGLASCTFWWASNKDMRRVFGPIAWNPDQIELGTQELIRSIRDLENSTSLQEKLDAESKFNYILKILWEKHWKNYKN